ncbi:ComEC/Rec2 family competence protein [uncultured Ruthenibacterium sp.]|uniref:ComEC/Rec2 family competence protein n=1 Tax=uncultured Ruthenibacterium sp. TaxID=1905347 RepID=UPI00349E4A6A
MMLERRRTLCLIGFTYLVVQLLAGFVPSAALGPLTAVFIVLLALLLIFHRKVKRVFLWTLICGVVSLALGMRMVYFRVVVDPVLALDGTTGWIEADVLQTRPGFSEERIYATVEVKCLNGERLNLPFQTQIEACPQAEPGNRISAQVSFSSLPVNEYLSNSQAKEVFICAEYVSGFQNLGIATGVKNTMLRWQMKLKDSLYEILPSGYRELASAICIGYKSDLPDEYKDQFQQAGLSHVLVVSGLHLSAVGAICYLWMKRFFNRRLAAVISCFSILAFMGVIGFTASVVRAGCVMILIYAGKILRRTGDTLTSMGLAALLLCIQNPFAAQDVGLLLSFSATLAVLFSSSVMERFYRRMDEQNKHPAKLLIRIYQTALVTFLVTIATLPAIASIGGGVSLVGILCNLAVLPVVPAVVLLGIGCSVMGLIPQFVFLSKLLGLGCGIGIRWMLTVTGVTSKLSWSMIYVSGIYAVLVSLCAIGMILLAWKLGFSLKTGVGSAACLALCAYMMYSFANVNVVHFAMVGSGLNPSVVVTQSDYTLVIYRGSVSNLEHVKEYLRSKNRKSVDYVIDLRVEGDSLLLAEQLNARETLCVQELKNHTVKTVFRDIMVYVKKQEKGNFACVDVGGRRLAIAAGQVEFTGYPALDVYFGGSGTPIALSAEAIVLPAAGTYDWAQNFSKVYQGPSEQEVWVRAGGQVKIDEVRNGFE